MRVGIVLPVSEDEEHRATRYADIRQLALTTEQAGLDSLWAADHLFYQPAGDPPLGFWESWTLLSALAEATSRVELGNLVLCVPFRNPGLLAYMANTLEEVSGGRLVLGLGSGWHEPEFGAFGFDFEHRVGVFEDSLAVLVALLHGGRVEHDGRFARGHGELRPRGPRPGGPPILIASKRPRMHQLAARYADRWNSAWYGMPSEPFWERRDGLHAACHDVGRTEDAIEINVGLSVVDEAEIDAGRDGSRLLVAQPEEIAEGLAAWQAEDVAEVMCRLEPATPAMIERVVRAAEILRRQPTPATAP
ncbi:MAG: LLM class flavin-dependent oxidoreductase [Chloroflexota bacterium]|nr:LLM class flavin-dependent oxidoreductase [Chloroflexota bacterium]